MTTITETDPTGSGSDRLTVTGLTAVAGVVDRLEPLRRDRQHERVVRFERDRPGGSGRDRDGSGGCTGTCGVNLGIGVGALVFTPDPTLRDGAGNTAAGSFTTAATFRLF